MTIEKFKEEMNQLLLWMNEKARSEKSLTLSDEQYYALLEEIDNTHYHFVSISQNDDTGEIMGYISLRDDIFMESNKKSPLLIGKTFNAYLAYALIFDKKLIELSEPLFLTIEPFYAGKPIDDISLMKKGSKTLDELYQLACQLDEEIDELLNMIQHYR